MTNNNNYEEPNRLVCATSAGGKKEEEIDRCRPCYVFVPFLQKEVYLIAAGVIGAVFLLCTLVMFLGVKEREGEIAEIIHIPHK